MTDRQISRRNLISEGFAELLRWASPQTEETVETPAPAEQDVESTSDAAAVPSQRRNRTRRA